MPNADTSPPVVRLRQPVPAALGVATNAYVLVGRHVTLVDPGPNTPEALNQLVSSLQDLSLELADIEQVVVTHAHIDHAGLAARVAEASGARVLGHPLAVEALSDWGRAWSDRLRHLERAAQAAGAPQSVVTAACDIARQRESLGCQIHSPSARPLVDGASVDAGNRRWRAVWTPGHAPDHVCLHERGSGSLILGDLLLRHIRTTPVLAPRPAASERLPALQELVLSWRRVSRLPTTVGWPGHGKPVRAHRILIARRLAELRARLQEARARVSEGAETVWQLAAGLQLPLGPDRVAVSLGEAGALAEWLAWRQLVQRRIRDSLVTYHPIVG